MDPYDSQTSQSPEPWSAPGGTPIYDRLVAEWQAAGHDHPSAAPHQEPALRRGGGFVPAARTPDDASGG
ncbi:MULTISPECIES: hypothetical protein [Streptomyces]|uniref:Uncharacterized protein n=1 Tax=Streptomyces cyaneofuscatus TaxID=66883 RepID=A0ABZ1F428_9ACTN|nr:hypothetical protein [Streptomyces cyaneofuscatus]WSB11165.1 hypothetical protein OG849_29900 [Streptomyces cyaneofuscatus]WSD45302.1 hypothetical protein OG857_05505 [Streptomyces cyaneofuscatus]WTA88496.1 hypothetical protein OG323_05590 [Streptomyces cyaneofuscatus]